MFISDAARYEFNIAEAAQYRATPAKLSAPTGEKLPAVMLKSGPHIKTLMPISEALRLANQIADAVEAHNAVTKAGV